MYFAEIALPLPLYHTFTYRVPENISLVPYQRVLVPFGRQKKVGFVTKIHHSPPPVALKEIERCLDEKPVASTLFFEWLAWGSDYYMAPLGQVLEAAFPSVLFKPIHLKDLQERKVRSSPLKGHWVSRGEISLSPAQKKILDLSIAHLHSREFQPILLHGVTGSGKTEIYLRFAEEVLKQGRQVIFLVPEIGLTPQALARFQHFFGTGLGVYHSGLTDNQRFREWEKARTGEISVVVGTRSALFAPFNRLGSIIIDEEQDGSYKQEELFRYHARDLALVRGKMEKIPVILGSATPALESYHNAHSGKYTYTVLSDRVGGALVPAIQLVDLASQLRQTQSPLVLCRELSSAIEENLKKGEQTLILFNRRGFARSFFCLACKKPAVCPNCSVNFVFHKKRKELVCHYCDASLPLPKSCPSCQSREVTLLGQGTQTVEEELKTFFPKARIARLDRDALHKKGELLRILQDLRKGRIDILVGTQMVAKGHDIPGVTLVGVVGIDGALGWPDFRAAERTFQLLLQAAGRSGRGSKPGRVIVQSFAPQHYSIQIGCAQDYEAFYRKEIEHRKELGYPPAGRLIQFQFSSTSEKKVEGFAQEVEEFCNNVGAQGPAPVQILGPAPAPLEKIRGRYRWHLLVKSSHHGPLRKTAADLHSFLQEKCPSGVKWAVDVDPVNML